MAPAELPPLPEPVLLRVLELLPPRDRLRAARVCRRWRRLALDRAVWRHVDLSAQRLSSRALWQLLRQRLQDSLRSLGLRGGLGSGTRRRLLSPALLAALGTRCPQLHRLALAETDLRAIAYESIPASLTALELNRCEIPSAWFCGSASGALPQLQHLIICNVPAFSDRHLLNVSSQSRLKTLSLAGTYRLTDAGIQRAAPQLEQLERLVLRGCGVGDSAMGSIGCHMKGLRFLEISDAEFLTNAGLARLTTLQHLETLSLDLGEKISLGAIIALCQELPQLRNLRLGRTRFEDEVTDKIRASLPLCSITHTP
ncbi:F-box/LRR-repeat protein 12-like [Patagioenas fasciata]|uniref:F-box/LRR-repeat protein 12-like n=1 Tax=Patagioenas fasciata TaxID=372321 RepID=UPI0032E8ECBC